MGSKRGKWLEKNGVVSFQVTSDGTTGPQWLERLSQKGHEVGVFAEVILRSENFKPTVGVTTEITVLKGKCFPALARFTSKMKSIGHRLELAEPSLESACLIREMFSNKELEEMGLQLMIVMHQAIKGDDGVAVHLALYELDGSELNCFWDVDNRLRPQLGELGFAFAAAKKIR